MKNKILIGIVILLAAVVFFVRFNFKSKLEVFKTSVSAYEKMQMAVFLKEKNEMLQSILKEDSTVYILFNQQFIDSLAITYKDTTYSYLYLNETIKFNTPKKSYLECLQNKCIVDSKNEIVRRQIDPKVATLEKKYGESFSFWFPQLKDKLLKKTFLKGNDCGIEFDSLYEIGFNEDSWKDFDRFLADYEKEKQKVDYESKKADDELDRLASYTRSKLKSGVINLFNSKINSSRNSLITSAFVPLSFTSASLGNINYNLTKVSVNKDKFDQIANEAFEEQWKYNSLSQGSMPYSYCYGSSNSCGDYDCSKISVLSGGSDVLVTIKNSAGKVCRHAYIKAGQSFKFSMPNGSYQVFFYSGTGWNPNKVMTTTNCGVLKGGFVSSESFTKDNYIDLYNQIMSYELILQQNGNLSTQPSSMNEAL